MQSRIEHGDFSGLDDYYQYLLRGGQETEWEELMIQLTCSESHFFRDKGQLQLLKNRIIPELIEKHQHKRSLRIWSAGCSTGEEAYTLAILLSELLQQKQDWHIVLIGSDINLQSICFAQKGIYRDWSFRGTDDEHMRRHFHQHHDGWEIDREIRKMVTFFRVDLMGDTFPSTSSGLFDMDLIICRNVFIYYGQDAINAVMRKFAATLTEQGYLLTGHAEVAMPEKSGLKLRSFAESAILQRSDIEAGVGLQASNHFSTVFKSPAQNKTARNKQLPIKQHKPLSHSTSTVQTSPVSIEVLSLQTVNTFFSHGDYRKASTLLVEYLRYHPNDMDANVMLARCYANMGDLLKASELCHSMIKENALCVDAYFILAQLEQEHNRIGEARALLLQAIYLAPDFLPAHMDLATIYQHQTEREKALKQWSVALSLVSQLDADMPIKHMEDVSCKEVLEHLKSMVNQ